MAAVATTAGTDLVLANHVLMGGPGRGAGVRRRHAHAVKIHGSELEYAIRGRPQLAGAGRRLARRRVRASSPARSHIVEVTEELLGEGASTSECTSSRPGVDTDAFRPGGGDLAA